MNEQSLFGRFHESPLLKKLVDGILMSSSQNLPAQFFLQNLHGSSTAFIIEAIFKNEATAHLNHLVVLNDAEEAAYFFNSVESVTEEIGRAHV